MGVPANDKGRTLYIFFQRKRGLSTTLYALTASTTKQHQEYTTPHLQAYTTSLDFLKGFEGSILLIIGAVILKCASWASQLLLYLCNIVKYIHFPPFLQMCVFEWSIYFYTQTSNSACFLSGKQPPTAAPFLWMTEECLCMQNEHEKNGLLCCWYMRNLITNISFYGRVISSPKVKHKFHLSHVLSSLKTWACIFLKYKAKNNSIGLSLLWKTISVV